MPKVTLYCTAACPYCVAAERFLIGKGVADMEKIRVDLNPQQREAMMEKTGRRTVPQIYVGAVHVGGYEDLIEWERSGRLRTLLAGE